MHWIRAKMFLNESAEMRKIEICLMSPDLKPKLQPKKLEGAHLNTSRIRRRRNRKNKLKRIDCPVTNCERSVLLMKKVYPQSKLKSLRSTKKPASGS